MEDEYTINVTPGYRSSRFGKQELRDIVVSMVVLAIAFSILYRSSAITIYLKYHLGPELMWVGLFLTSLLLVTFSFLLHELAHRSVARRYGMKSEYQMFPAGLVVTLITSMFGFLFAAPGAVYIQGYPDRRANGVISAAGPMVNIVLAIVGIVGCFAFNYTGLALFFYLFTTLNAFLAFFNLLPIPPLDGSKIFMWDKSVYIGMMLVALVILVYVLKFMTVYWAF